MPNSIFDIEAISKRRAELFPSGKTEPFIFDSRQGYMGSATNHCEICPKAPSELCNKPCLEARRELEEEDHVHVSIP